MRRITPREMKTKKVEKYKHDFTSIVSVLESSSNNRCGSNMWNCNPVKSRLIVTYVIVFIPHNFGIDLG